MRVSIYKYVTMVGVSWMSLSPGVIQRHNEKVMKISWQQNQGGSSWVAFVNPIFINYLFAKTFQSSVFTHDLRYNNLFFQ